MAQKNTEEVVLGDYVELSGHRMGMVKYIGPISGKKGIFYGVELWKGDGKHNGSYKGKQYFLCINAGMGVFVSPSAIIYILDVPSNYDPFTTLKAKRQSQQNKRSDSKQNGYSKSSGNSKSKKMKSTKNTNKRRSERKENEMDSEPQRPSKSKSRNPSETKMSVNEFKTISLKSCFGNGDNFDIAKRICKFYDDIFGDTDTVCLVSAVDLKPSHSLSVEGAYKRSECLHREGKYILVFRARPHIAATVLVSKQCFKSVVKGLSMDNESPADIGRQMDSLFGSGCHVVRSDRISFDIYSRFSDGYECELRLPNGGDYVLAWRR